MEAPVTTAMGEYKGQQVDQKPPRFDQVILKYKGRKPVLRRNIDGNQTEVPKNPNIDHKGRFKRFSFKEPFQDPRKTLLQFLQGNGEITNFCNIPYQKTSTYLTKYKGLQATNDVDLNVGDDIKIVSNFIGATSPDHTTWGKSKTNKLNNIRDLGWTKEQMTSPKKDMDLRRMIKHRFVSTASSPMHHTFNGDFGIQ